MNFHLQSSKLQEWLGVVWTANKTRSTLPTLDLELRIPAVAVC